MTYLQKRRAEVCQAIAEHIATHGQGNWNAVLGRFPGVSPSNFWRYRRRTLARLARNAAENDDPASIAADETKQSDTASVAADRGDAVTAAARAEQAKADERLFTPYGPMAPLFADGRNGGQVEALARRSLFSGRKSKRMTLAEAITGYEAAVLSKQRTGASCRRSLALVLDPLEGKLCAEVRLEHFLDPIQGLPPVHANRILAYLNAFFVWACDRGMVDYVPPFAVLKPVEEAARERSLTLSEIAEVWRAAGTMAYPFGPAVQLLILTVASREDVASMRKSDIYKTSHGEPYWQIHERNHGEQKPFQVPLPPEAFQLIETVWLRPASHHDLLFTTTGSTPISGWSRAKRKLDATIMTLRVGDGDENAAPMEPWRLNDLRRSFLDLGIQHLGEDEFLLGRCLNRMTECKSVHQRAWSARSDMFDIRMGVLRDWAQLVDGEVARGAASSG